MIYDLSMFSGEYDLLEIRLNLLSFVDKFIICEGAETFSGNPKRLYWADRDQDRFEEWEHKIIYHVVSAYDDPHILEQMAGRPYVGEPAFKRAFYQKESLRKVLEKQNPNDEDIVYYGDTDEVYKSKEIDDKVYKLRQLGYSYYLNNRSSEDWRGTIVTKWKNLKDGCLNDMRANPVHFFEDGGWHWTNLGGLEAVIRKIESYDHQEVNIPWVKDNMKARIEANADFLGRIKDYQGKAFRFWEDESDLPQWLLDNKERYIHLWK